HLALPVVDVPLETLRARDLPPFRAAIEAGARTVMTSHILLPQVDAGGPATFSSRILGDILRGELGFDGVIASGAVVVAGASGEVGIAGAAVRALIGGCVLLCLGTGGSAEQLDGIQDAVAAAIADGALEAGRLAIAEGRVVALAASLRDEPALP